MNERIRGLLNQMAVLEEELRLELHEKEAGLLFRFGVRPVSTSCARHCHGWAVVATEGGRFRLS